MRGLLVFIILAGALKAWASTPCGSFREDRAGSTRVVVFSDQAVARVIERSEVKSVRRVQVSGSRMILRDLETGQSGEYNLKSDGSQFETAGKDLFRERYVREKPGSCKAPEQVKSAPCPNGARDEFACALTARDKRDTATLQSLCGQGLALACLKLAELRDQDLQRGANDRPREPAECAQANSPEDTCGSLLSRSLMSQIGEVSRGSPAPGSGRAWPKAHLDELSQACQKIGSPALCRLAADRSWDAGHYLPAKALLDQACQRQLGAEACTASLALQKLGSTSLSDLKPASMLPCGAFRALNANGQGLARDIEFAHRGVVNSSQGRMHARVVEGLVRVRHDKGEDFILRPLGAQWLLGVDPWNRYTVFERQGGATQCTPPSPADDRALKDS